jgi:RNA polymerase-binding transcription factor DksA
MFAYELKCRECGWRTVCDREDATARLRLIGLLRRESDPDDDLIAALHIETAPRMTCPICKEKKLSASLADDTEAAEWQAAVLCEICRAPIPAERVEAIRGVKRCANCQQQTECGELADDEPEFCPHCGALVKLRLSRGAGITRYERVCTGIPPCRL